MTPSPHDKPGAPPLPGGPRFDWSLCHPSRFASRLATTPLAGAQVALIGLPDDTGVRLNGGRPGAADGPRAFREALARYGASEPGGIRWPAVADAGDVVPGASLDESHGRVTAAVSEILDAGALPVGIGGGHDLTFPFVRAVAARCGPMTGVYLDAHLDVRAESGSGMPFRRLVEDCGVRALHVHGLDPFANSTEHLAWFQANGGHVDSAGPDDPWPDGELFVSVDLDVLDQAFAPGVSAMNPSGWSPQAADRWAHAAGRNPAVRCFDIMELNPSHDEGGRTARLAARFFLSFLRGYSERPA